MTGTILTQMFTPQQILREDLWKSTPITSQHFHSKLLRELPPTARWYLKKTLSPGIPLATAVKLWIHGGIKLGQNGTFEGYTIPTRLRLGRFFGSEGFESEEEFFRCTITQAIYL